MTVLLCALDSDRVIYRQSKLSPTQLDELQRATHFDKKELQQWYKGAFGLVLKICYLKDKSVADCAVPQASSRTAPQALSLRRSSKRSTGSSFPSVTRPHLQIMSFAYSIRTTAG